jgi:hypothetical protein
MSNTQKKQAKRKARQKTQRRNPGRGTTRYMLPNMEASLWAQDAAAKAGLSQFEQKVAFMVGNVMSQDTWELKIARDDLVAYIAKAGEAPVAEVEAALNSIMEAGVLRV